MLLKNTKHSNSKGKLKNKCVAWAKWKYIGKLMMSCTVSHSPTNVKWLLESKTCIYGAEAQWWRPGKEWAPRCSSLGLCTSEIIWGCVFGMDLVLL